MRPLPRPGLGAALASLLLGLLFTLPAGCSAEGGEPLPGVGSGTSPKEAPFPEGDPPPSPDAERTAPFPFARCVVIGASASAGFGLPSLGEHRPNLADFLGAMLEGEPVHWACPASEFFFLQPDAWGRRQIDEALLDEPQLVVALDYLFWFGYGLAPSTDARRKRLEKGFALLAELPGTLVISELPDMSVAIGTMLVKEQVPSPEALALLNADLRAWARGRPNVIVAPMAEYVAHLLAGEAVQVGEHRYPEGSDRHLLQEDRLHPTFGGLAALATLVAQALVDARRDVRPEQFHWEPADLLPRVREHAVTAVEAAGSDSH